MYRLPWLRLVILDPIWQPYPRQIFRILTIYLDLEFTFVGIAITKPGIEMNERRLELILNQDVQLCLLLAVLGSYKQH